LHCKTCSNLQDLQCSCSIYLWSLLRKVFCFVCHVEISQTTTPPSTHLVPLESPQWGRVHPCGFGMFRPTLQNYWVLNNIIIKNLRKSKLKFYKNWGTILVLLENSHWKFKKSKQKLYGNWGTFFILLESSQ
jgi:hypothetical protein